MFASIGTWLFGQAVKYLLPLLINWVQNFISNWIGKQIDDKKIKNAFEKEDGQEAAGDLDDVFMRT